MVFMIVEKFYPTEMQRSPEYWQGHSAQDGCSLDADFSDVTLEERRTVSEVVDKEAKRLQPFYDNVSSQAREVFSVFMAKGASVPLAEFKPGSVFVPQDYNSGTVIKYSNESMWWGAGGEPHHDGSDTYYVIHESQYGKETARMLIAFSLLDNGQVSSGFPFEEKEVSVGNVEHFRSKDAAWTNEGVKDVLKRVNKVSILLAGASSPQEMPRLRKGSTRMIFGVQRSA